MTGPHFPDGVQRVEIDCGRPGDDDGYYVTISHDGALMFIEDDRGNQIEIWPNGAFKLGHALIAFANMMERIG